MPDSLVMILKMSALTFISIMLTYVMWAMLRNKPMNTKRRILVGVVFGLFSVLSTHFGVNYDGMVVNVRDLGPMSAGLFFDPVSGIIAGLIGGIERYFAGQYLNIGVFTMKACSIATCLAGFFAAFLNIVIFKGKKPSVAYSFFMGSVIEVFHMYAVFATHTDVLDQAFYVVKICAPPMITFSGIGLALASAYLRYKSGEWRDPFRRRKSGEVPVSEKFQMWLFGVTASLLFVTFILSYFIQTGSALQGAKSELKNSEVDTVRVYDLLRNRGDEINTIVIHIGYEGRYVIFDSSGNMIAGDYADEDMTDVLRKTAEENIGNKDYFWFNAEGGRNLAITNELSDGARLLIYMPEDGIFRQRDILAYEMLLADILIFTVIFVLISLLVQSLVVDNLHEVNRSLNRITEGNLDEKVSVYRSSEFTSLSDDINLTVDALKGYIDAAKKRIEQELLLAKTIQDSALPKNFDYNHEGFEIFASMDPAKEVGGDFYDFFFVDGNRIALVIADVSGKGIPAALFMMRSKTQLRSLAETGNPLPEVFERVNNELCEGNDANMFVTVWMAVANLETGIVKCINAGHEYPAIKRKDGSYELLKEKHTLPLGVMESLKFSEYEIRIEPGDSLFVYTDGVPEATNLKNEQYGTERMLTALNLFRDEPVEKILPAIKQDIDVFVGEAEQFDDVTMLGFSYNGINES